MVIEGRNGSFVIFTKYVADIEDDDIDEYMS